MVDILIFLSATTIKQMIPQINGEIDNDVIDGNTKFVQQTLIKDSLTQQFYDDLYLQWSGGSLSTAYAFLKENYIDWILALGVWANLILTQSYQLNSAGLRLKTTDHSTAAEAADIGFMRSYVQGLIDAKRVEMQRYIEYNPTGYELYWSDKYGDSPKTNRFRIGKVPTEYNNWYPGMPIDPGEHFLC